jgi:hypothetical protein
MLAVLRDSVLECLSQREVSSSTSIIEGVQSHGVISSTKLDAIVHRISSIIK